MATQNAATLPANWGKSGFGLSPTGPAASGKVAADNIDEFTSGSGTTFGMAAIFSSTISAANAITSTSPTGGVGYATGAGGAIIQGTSKSTGVTLSKASGKITMNAASLGATTTVGFTLTNTVIAATDVVLVNIASGGTASSYVVTVGAVAAGSCVIEVRNYTAGALAEALVLNFVVLKGVAA